MATLSPQARRPVEVIDLLSDDESDSEVTPATPTHRAVEMEVTSDDEYADYHTPPQHLQAIHDDPRVQTLASPRADQAEVAVTPRAPAMQSQAIQDDPRVRTLARPRTVEGGTFMNIDGEDVFIPDEDFIGLNDPVPSEADPVHDQEIALALDEDQQVTADTCLQRVLEVFPDISHDHVHSLYNAFDHEGDYETLPGSARLDNIIEQLVSTSSYPKQDKGKKRKREETVTDHPDKFWDNKDRAPLPHHLKGLIQTILKAEYSDIPVHFINTTLATERHLFHAFVRLAQIKDTSDWETRPYGKGRPSNKHLADAITIATNCGYVPLINELNAAQRRVESTRSERLVENAKIKAEQENLQKAIAAGETAECSACYDELPMNRQVHCNGPIAHFTCLSCMETYVKAEVGEARCRVLCPAGCTANFARNQLDLVADKQLLQKLAQLQQEKDIREAGLDDLEECPFCDYKAIVAPIEEDFEFRCANPECEKVSCRRCKSVSHVPLSCEQHAKDNKINSRHKIEEAMTAALIRSCNKCKKQFIKEYGCNKMACSCGNLQCYVCSATVTNYDHFDQNMPGRPGAIARSKGTCPLYDNVEERHEREVKEAEVTARAQVVEENPDVSAEDLEIKVSDAVKKATAQRVRQGVPGGGAYMPGGMHDYEVAFRQLDGVGEPLDFDFEFRRAARQRHRPDYARDRRHAVLAQPIPAANAILAQNYLARNNPAPAVVPHPPHPGLGPPIPGYMQIPVLGYPIAPPYAPPYAAPQPAAQPAAPAMPPGINPYRGVDGLQPGHVNGPIQHARNGNNFNRNYGAFGADGAQNLNDAANRAVHAAANPIVSHRADHQPPYNADPAPDWFPMARRQQVRDQMWNQPLQAGANNARTFDQNVNEDYRQLERLRLQHDAQAQQRDRVRQQLAQLRAMQGQQ